MVKLCIIALIVGQFYVIRTRDADNVVTFFSEGSSDPARAGSKTGETVRVVASSDFTTATTDTIDVPIYRFAAGRVVLRTPGQIHADVAPLRRRALIARITAAQAELDRVNALLVANGSDADLLARKTDLETLIGNLKTAAGIQ